MFGEICLNVAGLSRDIIPVKKSGANEINAGHLGPFVTDAFEEASRTCDGETMVTGHSDAYSVSLGR